MIRRKRNKSFKQTNTQIYVALDRDVLKDAIIAANSEIEESKRQKHIPTEFLKLPLNLVFTVFVVILSFFSLAFIIAPIHQVSSLGWSISNLFVLVVSFMIAAICGAIAFVCYKTNKDIVREMDRYYIVAYFSAMVSLVALVIALIGLIK